MSESELVPTPSVKVALAKTGATVSDVLKAALPEKAPEKTPVTPLPVNPALNTSAAALFDLADLLADVTLPDTHRQLSPAEQKVVVGALAALKPVAKALTVSEAQLKIALFNHLDEVARVNGRISEETLRTKEGWAIVEGVVEGESVNATREERLGSLNLTVDGLAELEERGEITHAEFLEMTAPARVLDERGAMAWLKKNPGRAGLLAQAASRSRATAALTLRPKK